MARDQVLPRWFPHRPVKEQRPILPRSEKPTEAEVRLAVALALLGILLLITTKGP